jgi:D-arabinose 1-dehydrogenase-like Zn-dependent alcohol dehydrogenase
MAAYTEIRSTHQTLTTTTADTVTLTGAYAKVEIINRHISVHMYAHVSNRGAAPTTAVSAADDTYVIPANGVLVLRTSGAGFACSVVGNANTYSVVGYDNPDDGITFKGSAT